jgi:hypothetical protein
VSGRGPETAKLDRQGIEAVDLTPEEAVARLQEELGQADRSLAAREVEAALDGYVRALSLALQLGPAAAEVALSALLSGAGRLVRQGDADGLCALGPAVAGAVAQVQAAGALPATPAMGAWAAVIDDLGALLGQVGLALSLPAERRSGMWRQARGRAALLDEATGNLFGLVDWLGEPPAW